MDGIKKITQFLWMGGVVSAIALGLVSCADKNKYQTPPLSVIEVSHPKIESVVHYFEYPASTQSLNTVDLVARVSGFLEDVKYRPGAEVQKGDLLFVIEPQMYKDKVDEAQAALVNAQASLRLSKESLDRVNEAFRSNAVSQIDVIKAQTSVDKSESQVNSSFAQLDQAKQNLQYCYVRAPFSGRISKNFIDKGNFVNNAQILATIYEDEEVYINFNVEDSKYMIILDQLQKDNGSKGASKIPIEVSIEGSSEVFKGHIDYVSPNVDLSTGTFSMRARVNNKRRSLSSGMYVRVRVPYATVEKAMAVPPTAIGSDQSGDYMYVINDSNVVVYRPVKVGVTTGSNLKEIVDGLSAHEYFVSKALLKVRDGMPIQPKKVDFAKEK